MESKIKKIIGGKNSNQKISIEKNALIKELGIRVTGRGKEEKNRNHIYRFYDCEKYGCRDCTYEDDINIENKKGIKDIRRELTAERKQLLKVGNYKITEQWACKWKKLKEDKYKEKIKINEFLQKTNEELFENERKEKTCYFEKISHNFVTWVVLEENGKPVSSPNKSAKNPDEQQRQQQQQQQRQQQQLRKLQEKQKDDTEEKIRLYKNLHEKENIPEHLRGIHGYKREQNYENLAGIKFRPNTRFNRINRLKLTRSIIESAIIEGGCGLAMQSLVYNPVHPLEGFFPLHVPEELKHLREDIKKKSTLFNPPIRKFREYFGEHIAFYFLFLSFYSKWLVSISIFGSFVYCHQVFWNHNHPHMIIIPLFILLLTIWHSCFLKFWKRKMAFQAIEWGMTNFKDTENDRPEFKGEWEVDTIKGEKEKTKNRTERNKAYCLSCSGVIICGIIILIWFLIIRLIKLKTLNYSGSYSTFVSYTPPIVNAIAILILDAIWGLVVSLLNDYENHRTNTGYINGVILKSFVFKFVNAYQGLFYIGLYGSYDKELLYCRNSYPSQFQQFLSGDVLTCFLDEYNIYEGKLKRGMNPNNIPTNLSCANDSLGLWKYYRETPDYRGDCLVDFMELLFILLMFRMVGQNIFEYIGIKLKSKRSIKEDLVGPDEFCKMSPIEQQFQDEQYENFELKLLPCRKKMSGYHFSYLRIGGTLMDYDELTMQFGYVVLFSGLFPIAPFMALMNNFVEMYLDAHKLTNMTRQPHPQGARDMGFWYRILQFLSWFSILSNISIFASNLPRISKNYPLYEILILLIICEHLLLLLKLFVMVNIKSLPESYKQCQSGRDLLCEIYV